MLIRHADTSGSAVHSTLITWILPITPVLIYDLNLGGGFVKFGEARPNSATLTLKIDLPLEGPITVNAEAVYRDVSGVAVRFVDMDGDTTARLKRNIEALIAHRANSDPASVVSLPQSQEPQ